MKIVATEPDSVCATNTDWRREMRQAIRDPQALAEAVGLQPDIVDTAACRTFPLFAPRPFVQRIRTGDPADPLLRQLLPIAAENQETPGFHSDPVRDREASRGWGVIQKYPGRALLVLTGACAIHCRYCFRREFPYQENQAWRTNWGSVRELLQADKSLSEVILSGGDPLTLDDEAWEEIIEDLQQIPHLRQLRIHTRLPIMIPGRMTDRWRALVGGSRLSPVLVIHSNHPAEIDDEVESTLKRLAPDMTLLNQSVLLRGINDHLDVLKRLSERLFECRVLPYYLNLLDRVTGTAHFEVTETKALELIGGLRDSLPGYLVPRLVRDDGSGRSKRIVA